MVDAGLLRVLARQREHLVGHVEPVGDARRADTLRGQDHVDAAAGTEVEHDLAFVQLGDRGRVPAAERRQRRSIRQLAALLGGVERLAERGLAALAADVAATAAALGAAAAAALGSDRGLRVALADLLSK